MHTSLDITCDPTKWSDLNVIEKAKLKLKAEEDIVFFWEHPAMGNVQTLWDSQKQLLREFNARDPETKRRIKKELLFSCGMRGSKTFCATLILLSELAKCLMMDNAQRFWDLLPKEEIYFLMTASTEEQSITTIFTKVIAVVEESPFFASFKNEINYTAGKLDFTKHRFVCEALGSNIRSNVGRTVKVFVAEEINFTGDESYKVSPRKLYNRLSKSTLTFKPFGEDVKVAISSQADGNDFLSKRIKLTRDQKLDQATTLIWIKTTLEMNPNIKMEHIEDERLMDEESFSQDLGFGVIRDGSKFFKKIPLDKIRAWDGVNIFQGEPEIGSSDFFEADLIIDNLVYDKNAVEYGVFTDPASTGDGFGFVLAHLTIDDKIIIDGMTVLKPSKKQEVDSHTVRMFIEKIINKVPVAVYGYDIYMYKEIKDDLVNLGIVPYQNIIKLPGWEALKDRINTDRISGPFSEYLIKEVSDLKKHNGKVDHPNGGSKDMLDAVCQPVCYWDQIGVKDPEMRTQTSPLIISGY